MKTAALSFLLLAPTAGALAVQGSLPPVNTPGGPSRPLNDVEAAQWLAGRALFDLPFHKSRGLGAPEMNADSCRGCHQDPAIGGAGGLELNVSRVARNNLGQGPFTNLPGGQGLSKLRPPYTAGREEYDPLQADVFEQRQTPSIFGAGLVDQIPDAEILANEDPLDLDLDGVRGVARMLTIGGNTEIGRFGWKGQVPHLRDFIKDAMGGELGITTPDDARGFAMLSDADTHGDPELSESEIDDMFFFLANLAAPQRLDPGNAIVLQGESLFASIGCVKCHVPSLLGPSGPVPLYSDLLLHDVMPSNYNGMEEPGAGNGVFKTPPLWGIRDTAPYLHDGRAETIRQAIELHAGEASAVVAAFQGLSAGDRDALLAFLNDL
jgi:CxxC motif-containing protein (DUF1111 family)